MTDEAPECPHKRLELDLHIDAHDAEHLSMLLTEVLRDLDRHGNLPAHCTSGSGYWFNYSDAGADRTREVYEAELDAWFQATRVPA